MANKAAKLWRLFRRAIAGDNLFFYELIHHFVDNRRIVMAIFRPIQRLAQGIAGMSCRGMVIGFVRLLYYRIKLWPGYHERWLVYAQKIQGIDFYTGFDPFFATSA